MAEVDPGTYELERIRHPRRHSGDVLVLKGTLIGAPESFWRMWPTSQTLYEPDSERHGQTVNWGRHAIQLTD